MTKKQQQILAVGAVIGLIALAVAYFVGARPQLAQRSANQANAALAQQQTTALSAQLNDLKAKQADLPEAQAQVEDLFKKFPNTYRQDQWIDMVSAAAAQSGVKILSVTPTTPVDATAAVDPTTGLPIAGAGVVDPTATNPDGTPAAAAPAEFPLAQSTITITAEGPVPNLRVFVVALGKMQRPLLIDGVTVTNGETGGSISIVGKTFLSRPLDTPVAQEQAQQ